MAKDKIWVYLTLLSLLSIPVLIVLLATAPDCSRDKVQVVCKQVRMSNGW